MAGDVGSNQNLRAVTPTSRFLSFSSFILAFQGQLIRFR